MTHSSFRVFNPMPPFPKPATPAETHSCIEKKADSGYTHHSEPAWYNAIEGYGHFQKGPCHAGIKDPALQLIYRRQTRPQVGL